MPLGTWPLDSTSSYSDVPNDTTHPRLTHSAGAKVQADFLRNADGAISPRERRPMCQNGKCLGDVFSQTTVFRGLFHGQVESEGKPVPTREI